MAEKDQEQQSQTQGEDGKEINDPLTRSDVEARREEFEGTKPE